MDLWEWLDVRAAAYRLSEPLIHTDLWISQIGVAQGFSAPSEIGKPYSPTIKSGGLPPLWILRRSPSDLPAQE